VAADQQRPVGSAAQREPLIAGRIDLLDRAGALDLLPQETSCGFPRIGPRNALSAVLVAGQLAQLLEVGDCAPRVQRHEDDPKP
jgi:hypothetical protein